MIFGPLAALARATGRNPAAAWLHGEDSPARIPAPDTLPTPAAPLDESNECTEVSPPLAASV